LYPQEVDTSAEDVAALINKDMARVIELIEGYVLPLTNRLVAPSYPLEEHVRVCAYQAMRSLREGSLVGSEAVGKLIIENLERRLALIKSYLEPFELLACNKPVEEHVKVLANRYKKTL
jgi:hypothetical protein